MTAAGKAAAEWWRAQDVWTNAHEERMEASLRFAVACATDCADLLASPRFGHARRVFEAAQMVVDDLTLWRRDCYAAYQAAKAPAARAGAR